MNKFATLSFFDYDLSELFFHYKEEKLKETNQRDIHVSLTWIHVLVCLFGTFNFI